MADQTFQNVINGELVDAAVGRDLRRRRPDAPARSTRRRRCRAPRTSTARTPPRTRRSRAGATRRPAERPKALLKIADAHRRPGRRDRAGRVEGHRQAARPDRVRGAAAELDHFRFFAGAARVLEGKSAGEYLADHTSFIRREPIGVVGQVTPWNYPLMMMIWKIAPALAAGNTIVLKPSDTTPASSTLLAELCQEFLPPGVLNVVLRRPRHRPGAGRAQDPADGLDHRLGARRHGGRRRRPRPTSSGCTSSSAARRRSSSSTTPTSRRPPPRSPRPATSTPARTAPPPPGCSPGPASTTTSSPPSPSRPRQPRPACPTTRTCSTAPLNNADQLARVTGMVDRLPDHATLETGGHRQGEAGYFYEPTVLSGLKQDDEQIQDEIFGPVITVQRFTDEAEALAWANGVQYGLASVGVDQGPRPGDADVAASSTSAWCGSTPTSRSSPRCRTAASSTPATARTCPCTASRTTPGSSTSCPTSASRRRETRHLAALSSLDGPLRSKAAFAPPPCHEPRLTTPKDKSCPRRRHEDPAGRRRRRRRGVRRHRGPARLLRGDRDRRLRPGAGREGGGHRRAVRRRADRRLRRPRR